MPSRFEPCGLNQLTACGTGRFPIVARDGGLADTVVPYDEQRASQGTGLVFHDLTPGCALRRHRVGGLHSGTTAPIISSRCDRKRCAKTSRGTRSAIEYEKVYHAARAGGAAVRSLRDEGMTSAMRAMVLERPDRAARSLIPKDISADPRRPRGSWWLGFGHAAYVAPTCSCAKGTSRARRLPIVPGRQVVGMVESVGEGLTRPCPATAWAWHGWAVHAAHCVVRAAEGRENSMRAGADSLDWDIHGGFATHVAVRADFALRLPRWVRRFSGRAARCAGHHRVPFVAGDPRRTGGKARPHGFGASALMTIQVARHFGCRVFVAPRVPSAIAKARRLGAEWTGGYDDRPPEAPRRRHHFRAFR